MVLKLKRPPSLAQPPLPRLTPTALELVLPGGVFESSDQLVKDICRAIKTESKLGGSLGTSTGLISRNRRAYTELSLIIDPSKVEDMGYWWQLKMTDKLALALGLTDLQISERAEGYVFLRSSALNPSLMSGAYTEAWLPTFKTTTKTIVFHNGVNIHRHCPDLWVCSDIVQAEPVGDSPERLLRIVPAESPEHLRPITYRIKNPWFKELARTEIREIAIQIKSSVTDKPIGLLNPTTVELEFKNFEHI